MAEHTCISLDYATGAAPCEGCRRVRDTQADWLDYVDGLLLGRGQGAAQVVQAPPGAPGGAGRPDSGEAGGEVTARHWEFTEAAGGEYEVRFQPRPRLRTYRLTLGTGRLHLYTGADSGPPGRHQLVKSFESVPELTGWLGGQAVGLLRQHRKLIQEAQAEGQLRSELAELIRGQGEGGGE